ncbi:hypothetical protein L211DRAFT_136273 [Terfezia boudieri ATCC MYA-4762]|uniref:Uncharacterized protein n=1 Tax=Terfezia boudieri ATCC MYA-4762 TaxID=1051890 RepID=A0A3N4LQ69_9PEZI|nr:hypothetical protein L211DRAFT_136273 [Terfezia boudieri ATCC MYA-4762]
MEKQKARKLVITLESFSPSAIETQASLLPIPPNSTSQVLCLPLIPLAATETDHEKPYSADIAQITGLEQLPLSTIQYILSLREQWLTRLEVCINSILGGSDSPAQRQWQGAEERVVFMLGGITGVKFACARKIAEDVTGGDIILAKDIFERVQTTWNGALLEERDNIEERTPPQPTNQSRKRDIATPTRRGSDTPILMDQSQNRSPNSRVTLFSTPAYLPIDSQDTLINDIQTRAYECSITPSRTDSYATAASSPEEVGAHNLVPEAYALDFEQDTPTSQSNQYRFSTEPLNWKLKRSSSLIQLPPATPTPEYDSLGAVLNNVNDTRRKASTPLGTSWCSRDSKIEDSALAALLERSLSIKRATSYEKTIDDGGAMVITGGIKAFEEFGGHLPKVRQNVTGKGRSYTSDSSFVQLAADDIQFPIGDSGDDQVVNSCHSCLGLSSVDIRSSWLAPPTAGGELEEMLGLSRQSRSAKRNGAVESHDLFPSLLRQVRKSFGTGLIEREWAEGVLYLDEDTPSVCLERVVYALFLAESFEDEALKEFQPRYQLPRTSSPDARFPSGIAPEAWTWKEPTAKYESMPLFPSSTNVRKIKLSGKKRKNGIQIQNELRSFVRELTQATSIYELDDENESVFEESPSAGNEAGVVSGEEEEPTLSLWRDMFSTHGQWPVSTVNLIVALGREGPTNTVKGGSGRVMAEAMARRLEGWDLRCRRISLRYLLYLARRNGHLGSVTPRPPPRQLIAELEFFLSLHEPTDLLILEYNTSSREETEAVLELSGLLGRGSHHPPSGHEPSTMLRMACVFSGEVPRDVEVHGIVVGNSPDFATSSTRSDSTLFEGFRFPTCRSPGNDKQKHRPISEWVKNLTTVADLVVEDNDAENESRQQRHQSVPLETRLEHVFTVLDHWTAVARLRPASIFEVSGANSPTHASPQTPPPIHQSQHIVTPPSKPTRKRNTSRTLLEVIVTAFTEVDGEDTDKQEYRRLTTCREVFCQSPSSGGTFLEDAVDEEIISEDDFDLGINGFEPSIGIIEAHEQSDTEVEEEEETPEDGSVVEDYDMVVAMQYGSQTTPRLSRKQSKSRKKRTQIWFRSNNLVGRSKKRTEAVGGSRVPALKKMKIMRLSGGCGPGGRLLHGRTRSKDEKGQLGLVLVSTKAMKLLGLERESGFGLKEATESP